MARSIESSSRREQGPVVETHTALTNSINIGFWSKPYAERKVIFLTVIESVRFDENRERVGTNQFILCTENNGFHLRFLIDVEVSAGNIEEARVLLIEILISQGYKMLELGND